MEIEYTENLPYNGDPLWHNDLIVRGSLDHYRLRDEMVKKYAWAIPTEEALQLIAKFSPLVEVGAGTGYWAYELKRRGAEIHAYDQYPPDGSEWSKMDEQNFAETRKNWYHRGHPSWVDVKEGTPEILREYDADWNLFLCWPPYDDPMALDSLLCFQGTHIVYIGESAGGCNGTDRFFTLLNRRFEEVAEAYIPSWPGIHDYLTVYKRKET